MNAQKYDNRIIKFGYKNLGSGVTEVTAPLGEKIYVIEGTLRAMVIDTGTGVGSLKQCIDEFCVLPLIVVNTHGHPDHAGGNAEFQETYLHPDDKELFLQMCTRTARAADMKNKVNGDFKIYEDNLQDIAVNILPLSEGQEFDLGGRKISVYKLEGHTEGSVVLYDSLTEWLFVGDAICAEDTWMHLDHSASLVRYRDALSRFIAHGLTIKKILSGHEPNIAQPDLFNDKLKLLNKVISGELVGIDTVTFVGNGKRARYNNTGLVYNENKITDDQY